MIYLTLEDIRDVRASYPGYECGREGGRACLQKRTIKAGISHGISKIHLRAASYHPEGSGQTGRPSAPGTLARGKGRVTETNPMGLTYAMSTRYEVSRQNKPNRAILRAINGMQPKSGRFSTKTNA